MKPNDDEQREIAAKLRSIADENGGKLGTARMQRVPLEAQDAMGTRGLRSVAHVLLRHAELIEPEPERTCRAVARYHDDDSTPWPFLVCSECGEKLRYRDVVTEHGEESCEMLPYCAGCGAKVVGE